MLPFDCPGSAMVRELEMLAAKSCTKTKPFLHAAAHGGRNLDWLVDDKASRDLDGYDATASSDSARCG